MSLGDFAEHKKWDTWDETTEDFAGPTASGGLFSFREIAHLTELVSMTEKNSIWSTFSHLDATMRGTSAFKKGVRYQDILSYSRKRTTCQTAVP